MKQIQPRVSLKRGLKFIPFYLQVLVEYLIGNIKREASLFDAAALLDSLYAIKSYASVILAQRFARLLLRLGSSAKQSGAA